MKFGFVTCLQDHISLSDKFDTWLCTSECTWLWLNRQSFYHYWKQQLVPTDRYLPIHRGNWLAPLIGLPTDIWTHSFMNNFGRVILVVRDTLSQLHHVVALNNPYRPAEQDSNLTQWHTKVNVQVEPLLPGQSTKLHFSSPSTILYLTVWMLCHKPLNLLKKYWKELTNKIF